MKPEEKARQEIDQLLEKAGWKVQDYGGFNFSVGTSRFYVGEIYPQKCNAVYQHIFESYYGEGRSVYGAA